MLMAKCLGWVSQGHEMYCLNLEDMGLNPGQVEIEACSTQYLLLSKTHLDKKKY